MTKKTTSLKTPKQFETFFKALPATKWITGNLHNSAYTAHCAMGHLKDKHGVKAETEIQTLNNLFYKYFKTSIASINDNTYSHETLTRSLLKDIKSPKERILAALRYILKQEKTLKGNKKVKKALKKTIKKTKKKIRKEVKKANKYEEFKIDETIQAKKESIWVVGDV